MKHQNQKLNKHIAEVFDNVMSENTVQQPIGASSLDELRKKAVIGKKIKRIQPKKVSKRKIKPKTIKKKIIINKPKKINKVVLHEPSKFDKLKNISKQSLIGASIFTLLSLPPIINISHKILPNNTSIGIYKELIIRALLFTIIYALVSKYLM